MKKTKKLLVILAILLTIGLTIGIASAVYAHQTTEPGGGNITSLGSKPNTDTSISVSSCGSVSAGTIITITGTTEYYSGWWPFGHWEPVTSGTIEIVKVMSGGPTTTVATGSVSGGQFSVTFNTTGLSGNWLKFKANYDGGSSYNDSHSDWSCQINVTSAGPNTYTVISVSPPSPVTDGTLLTIESSTYESGGGAVSCSTDKTTIYYRSSSDGITWTIWTEVGHGNPSHGYLSRTFDTTGWGGYYLQFRAEYDDLNNCGYDDSSDESGSVYVTPSVVQYQLTVNSDHGITSGSGLYNSGDPATFSVGPTTVDGGAGIQYVFIGWTGDYTGTENPHTITMDGNKTVTAVWQTQYYLTINSAHGSPTQSSGWYDAGAPFSVSVTSPDVVTPDQDRWVCTGYSVDGSPLTAGDTWSIGSLDGPYTIEFAWQEQYYVTIISAHDSPTQSSGWYDAGSPFSVSVTDDIVTPSEHQWICTGYSVDGSPLTAGDTWSIGSLDGPYSIEFAWQEQFYLTVVSTYGTPSGEGWYNAGDTAYFSVAPTTVSGGAGIQYVFDGWLSGDPGEVVMNSAITETAVWQTQYYLTVVSTYGTTSGEGWYDEGVMVGVGLTPTGGSGGSGVQYLFTGWASSDAGGYTGADNPCLVTMFGPITQTANWKTQFYLTIVSPYGTASGEGWYDEGTVATFSVTTPVSGGIGIQHLFTGWASGDFGGYSGTDNTRSIIMVAPITETAGWQTQYYVTITSTYGSPTQSSGWYDAGISFSVSVTSPDGIIPGSNQWVCTGYNLDDEGLVADTSWSTGSLDGPHTIVFNWEEENLTLAPTTTQTETTTETTDQNIAGPTETETIPTDTLSIGPPVVGNGASGWSWWWMILIIAAAGLLFFFILFFGRRKKKQT
jgi:uncharacterized repeat protein (TIGR02543 family)